MCEVKSGSAAYNIMCGPYGMMCGLCRHGYTVVNLLFRAECSLQYNMSGIIRHGYTAINLLARLECVNGVVLVGTRLDRVIGTGIRICHRLA